MVPTHICTTHYKNNADMSGLLETGHMWTCQCVGTRDSETKIRYELQGYAKTLTERGHIGNSLYLVACNKLLLSSVSHDHST